MRKMLERNVVIARQKTYLEAFLKVFVFLEERSVVDDDLSICNPEL